MSNSKHGKNISLGDKISRSFNEFIEDAKTINEIDRSRILKEFEVQDRKNKLEREFKKKMIKKNNVWKHNLIRYKNNKEDQIEKRSQELIKKLNIKTGANAKKLEEIEKEKQKINELRKRELMEAQIKTRRKIINHLDNIEEVRLVLQEDLEEKCKKHYKIIILL